MDTTPPERPPHRWRPIEDLPDDRSALEAATIEVAGLRRAWLTKKQELETSGGLAEFNRRLIRLWCIETGVIEGIYSVSEGVTKTLVEKGFDAAYISHGDTDVPTPQLIAVLKDHERAVEGLFAFVKHDRELTTSYVKQLHAVLTAHQEFCDAEDQFGNAVKVPLIRGDWKKLANNPSAGDPLREVHEYCPPEHVASEMDRLIAMHAGHSDFEPEISAAWLHHRFTQVHPFQDGNGRVARALATLVLIQRRGFPLVVLRGDKPSYVDALRTADDGDILPLTVFFCRRHKEELLSALDDVAFASKLERSLDSIIEDAAAAIQRADVAAEGMLLGLHTLAARLRDVARDRLLAVEGKLSASLGPKLDIAVFSSNSDKQHFFSHQILETARVLRYPASVSGRREWARLRIRHGPRSTSFVVSIHHVGAPDSDTMAASAFVEVRHQPPDGTSGLDPSQLSCTEPFTFTEGRTIEELTRSFEEWLDIAIALGLGLWRRDL